MALSNAERQRAYRARKRGEAEASLEGRVKALEADVVALRGLVTDLRATVVGMGMTQQGVIDHSRMRPPVAMNPAMQAFVQQQRPVTGPTVSAVAPPVDDWEPA